MLGRWLWLQLERRLTAGVDKTCITCMKLGYWQPFVLVLDEEIQDLGNLSELGTNTHIAIPLLAFAGYFSFNTDSADIFRIQITILHHASLIQEAIIVAAKKKTSAWGKILQARAVKVFWCEIAQRWVIPALPPYVVQLSSLHLIVPPSYFFSTVPLN